MSKKILVHGCCGPCSIMPVKLLKKENYIPVVYFFNPNIHLSSEYVLRLESMRKAAEMMDIALIEEDNRLYFNSLQANNCVPKQVVQGDLMNRYAEAIWVCAPTIAQHIKQNSHRKILENILHTWRSPNKTTQNISIYNKNSHGKSIHTKLSHDKTLISFQDVLLWVSHLDSFQEKERCKICYRERLYYAARKAALEGFPFFTTSLLYSRYQNFEDICMAAEEAVAKIQQEIDADVLQNARPPKFLQQDFRVHWQDGIDQSKQWGLYRQKWCGCALSRMESLERLFVKKINNCHILL